MLDISRRLSDRLPITALRTTAMTLAVVAAATIARADPVFPPASGVGLEPPPGMKVASAFNGFQAGPASIVVTEMPKEAYPQIDAKRAAFVQRFGASSADDVTLHGVKGFLIKGTQKAPDKTYRKWILVLDAPTETALVSAQVPDGDTTISDAAIDAALQTVAFRPRPDLAAQIAALPFSVGDLAGFRPAISALGAALVLTDGPKNVDPNQSQAHIVVAADLGHPPGESDKVAFAENLLKSYTAVRTGEIKSAKAFDADGVQWVEVDATGNEGAGNTPVGITLFIRFQSNEFLSAICIAPIEAAPRYAERFKTVALSVKPKG